jgi:hypothetical protein
MIKCQNCNSDNYLGALFCAECGAQLQRGGVTTQSLSADAPDVPAEVYTEEDFPSGVSVDHSVVTLHFLETDQFLPLFGRTEFTLGRINAGQTIQPDVDLTPYNGYKQGVSRMHATIQVKDDAVILKDLGSVNGTRLNGAKLVPHLPNHLKHGDMLLFGKLKVQAVIRK